MQWAMDSVGSLFESRIKPPNELLNKATKTFKLIAGLDRDPHGASTMSKAELVEAHFGDTAMFQAMDKDNSGLVTNDEWREWLIDVYNEKGEKKGGKWMHHLLDTLTANVNENKAEKEAEAAKKAAEEKAAADAAARKAEMEALFKKAHDVFVMTAAIDGEGETMTKDELVQAHKGDFKARTSDVQP